MYMYSLVFLQISRFLSWFSLHLCKPRAVMCTKCLKIYFTSLNMKSQQHSLSLMRKTQLIHTKETNGYNGRAQFLLSLWDLNHILLAHFRSFCLQNRFLMNWNKTCTRIYTDMQNWFLEETESDLCFVQQLRQSYLEKPWRLLPAKHTLYNWDTFFESTCLVFIAHHSILWLNEKHPKKIVILVNEKDMKLGLVNHMGTISKKNSHSCRFEQQQKPKWSTEPTHGKIIQKEGEKLLTHTHV